MPHKVSLLKRQIESAFADVPYPGDDNLSSHNCSECNEIVELVRGKHWRDLKNNPKAIFLGGSDMTTLSPEAWVFYMPVFLFTMLDGAERGERAITQYLQEFAMRLRPSFIPKSRKEYPRLWRSYLWQIGPMDRKLIKTTSSTLRHIKTKMSDEFDADRVENALSSLSIADRMLVIYNK